MLLRYRKERQDVVAEPKVKESFDKGKKVATFFKSSTIGRNNLAKVQKELYDLGIRLVEARMQDEVVIHAYYGWRFDEGTGKRLDVL